MASLQDDLKVAAERLGVEILSSAGLTEMATLDQSSDSWSAERLCRLTASDLAAALGRSRWSSPAQALSRYLGSSEPLAQIVSPAMAHSIEHEQIAANAYLNAQQHSQACTLVPVGLCVHQYLPGFAASPDRLVFHSGAPVGLLEIKCPFSCPIPSSVEPEHRLQAILQLACQPFSWPHAEVQWQWADVCYWSVQAMIVHRVHWDTATRRRWEQEILPRAAFFYSRQLAPALQQVLVNLTSSGIFDTHLCAATPGSQSQLADQLSSIPHYEVASTAQPAK